MRIRLQSAISGQPYSSKEIIIETGNKKDETIKADIDRAKGFLDYIESTIGIQDSISTDTIKKELEQLKKSDENMKKLLAEIRKQHPKEYQTIFNSLFNAKEKTTNV